MKTVLSVFVVACLALGSAAPVVSAQTPAQDPNAPPATLVIFREEVKPGKGAAHTANEVGWAAMMAKAQWPTGWLGTTSITGPSEAWFFTGFGSLAEYDKDRLAQDAAESLRDSAKFSAQDGELLTRTSTLIGTFRPQLSYQPVVSLPKMRYFSIDTVVVKPGYAGEFIERWQEVIAAHTKATLDEHWAVYEITSGGQVGTYLFFYALDSLAPLDESAAKHRATAYRDAVGEGGRSKNNEMSRSAIDWQQNRIFAFSPKMSYLNKTWIDVDPPFWAPQPPPVPPAAKKK
jgi:hypothetical protein